jgi:hypothetical protein
VSAALSTTLIGAGTCGFGIVLGPGEGIAVCRRKRGGLEEVVRRERCLSWASLVCVDRIKQGTTFVIGMQERRDEERRNDV